MRLTLSICLLIISSCVFAQVNLNQGLLAYYPFSGNANDATGNGNNGTLMNGVQLTTDRFGNPNSAYHFDGIDDYIIVNDNGNLSPQNVTVVAMVYAEQSTAQSITGKIQYTTGYHATYHLGINYDIQSGFFWGLDPSGFSCYQQIPYDPINNPFVTSPAYFSPNVWHCVVGTFENSVQKLYVDGVLVGTRIDNFTSLDQCTNTNFLIGRWWTGDPIPFKGKIDEVRVYNRALNQAEINALCEYSSTQFSCNNWLNTPSLPSFFSTLNQVNVTGNQITVEALINRTTPYSGGPLYAGDVVSKHNDPTDVNYLLRPNTAEITTSTGYHRTPDVCDIQLNKTYHVAMVYDGTTLKFYRNGFLMSQTNATGNLVQNNWQTRVGFYQSAGFNTNFIGYINEVRIWNVARTQAQIQGYMNSSLPSPTTQSGLLAYYIYDNLLNKQGNPAYNGTLGGSAAINQTNPNCSLIIDSCATTPPPTFGCSGSQFAIGGTGYDRAFDVAATTNNEYYVAGVSKSFSGNDDLLITRVTNAGNTVWAKKIGNAGAESVRKITATADGGVLVTGQTKSFSNPNGDILCMKLNSAGSLLWSKVFGLGSSNGDLGMDIIETTDGGYAVSGIINVVGFIADAFVAKLDNAANIVWAKRYSRTSDGEDGVGILQKSDTLIVTADLQNGGSHYEFTLMKVKLTDGSFISCKKYTPTAHGLFNPYIFKNPAQTGYLVSGHTIDYDTYTTMNHTVIAVDENFNFLHSALVSVAPVTTNDFFTGFAPLSDGSWIGCATPQLNADAYAYRIRSDNTIVYSKRINAATDRRFYRLAVSNNRVMAVGGAVTGGQEDFYLNSFDINGISDSSCDVENAPMTIQQPTYTVTPFTWAMYTDISFPNTVSTLTAMTVSPTKTDLCPVNINFDFNYQLNVCNPLAVQFNGVGADTVAPYWSFGDGGIVTNTLNPSHTYPAFGNYLIKYSAGNGICRDTISKIINISVTPADIILTHDTTICFGTTKQLLTAPSLSFCWTPTTYLNNPNSANPVTSTPQNITYYFTAQVEGTNLITNGNFSQGNTGFTSQYNYANPNVTEGQYYVGTNPQAWNSSLSPCPDHTTGSGNMMLINGSPTPNVNVWTETVTVTPNTNYAFSTWIQALWPPNPAQLKFSINGNQIGTTITATLPTCTWTQFYTTWNSGANTSATISIVNVNTAIQGNDFALDDISFSPVLIKKDSVVITVEKPSVTTNADTSFCQGLQVQLNSTGANSYAWTPPAGLSNPNIANPVASPAATTQYIVTGTTVNGCTAKDTVLLTIVPSPVVTMSTDTTICKNNSVQLFAGGGTNYSWTPSASLNNPNIANPVATPTTNTIYKVIVGNSNNCTSTDSVRVDIYPDPVFSISSPASVCRKDSLQLIASGGNIYNWQPLTDITNPNIPNPKVFPQNTTTYTVQITETNCNNSTTLSTTVTVFDLPNVKAFKSNNIDCSSDFSQLNATGAVSYTWSPSASLNNPNIANPVATPTIQTLYTVRGKDANNCVNSDTVTVDITSFNKGAYLMPSAFTPNNDGLNDCYGIKYWGVIDELDFSIYNRWGEKVFHTKDPNACWDGTYKGQKQDSNVFVYLITAKTNCGEIKRKGTFVLIR